MLPYAGMLNLIRLIEQVLFLDGAPCRRLSRPGVFPNASLCLSPEILGARTELVSMTRLFDLQATSIIEGEVKRLRQLSKELADWGPQTYKHTHLPLHTEKMYQYLADHRCDGYNYGVAGLVSGSDTGCRIDPGFIAPYSIVYVHAKSLARFKSHFSYKLRRPVFLLTIGDAAVPAKSPDLHLHPHVLRWFGPNVLDELKDVMDVKRLSKKEIKDLKETKNPNKKEAQFLRDFKTSLRFRKLVGRGLPKMRALPLGQSLISQYIPSGWYSPDAIQATPPRDVELLISVQLRPKGCSGTVCEKLYDERRRVVSLVERTLEVQNDYVPEAQANDDTRQPVARGGHHFHRPRVKAQDGDEDRGGNKDEDKVRDTNKERDGDSVLATNEEWNADSATTIKSPTVSHMPRYPNKFYPSLQHNWECLEPCTVRRI